MAGESAGGLLHAMVAGCLVACRKICRVRVLVLILGFGYGAGAIPAESTGPAVPSLGPSELAVIVNEEDPLSRKIAAYYAEKRDIPAGNIVPVHFPAGKKFMTTKKFARVMAEVTARVPESVQAYVLTWTAPYRVGCMSITTAFAAGYNEAFCARGCKDTQQSPYYNSNSHRPYDDFGWRPTMMLAGKDFGAVKALIDRGVAADGSRPGGTGYLLSTTDKARNGRARFYPGILLFQSDRFAFRLIQADALRNRDDVMFYFTGRAEVDGIATNTYLPGAIADHLTSAGGKLTDSRQMSSLRWLEAGATGSYGTVVEPCSFTEKFPRPDLVIDRYLDGETLLEAYWKSVAWPGQGVFIGEPLAAPFRNPPDP
jgi:uncharacterized protein (TIGR03790 family)